MAFSKGLKYFAGIVLALGASFLAAYYLIGPTTIQTKSNPTRSHHAKLIRYDGIDVNFQVVVDRENVFWSADFAPVKLDFREQIIWDETGKIIVLEVAGKRLFAFDAEQKQVLSSAELNSVKYPQFKEFRYEGTLIE